MKRRIHEFDPVIYPTRLWVAISPDFRSIDRDFYCLDNNGEVVDDPKKDYDGHTSAIATTFLVAHRKSGWKGCLVAVWKRKECGAGICAHEGTHVVDWIDGELGLGGHSFDDGEPRAYLTQWVANCIDRVIRGKV